MVPMAPSQSSGRSTSRAAKRSEEHTSELQSRGHLVCRLLLENKKLYRHPRRHRHGPAGLPRRVAACLESAPTRRASILLPGADHHARSMFARPLFFFNDTATTDIYTLSLHDALPIPAGPLPRRCPRLPAQLVRPPRQTTPDHRDRKSTRLNSSHVAISYAVFCLK